MRAYHYTNPEAFENILTGRGYGVRGLQPMRRFVRYGWGDKLPEQAHDGIIEALLEPEPEVWMRNEKYPTEWFWLMHDVCRREQVMLLSFNVTPKDKAYVVERAHIEDILFTSKHRDASDDPRMNVAARNYFNSRVPAHEYVGGYSLPQFAIWSPIRTDRLRVEWVMNSDDWWASVKNHQHGFDKSRRIRKKLAIQ